MSNTIRDILEVLSQFAPDSLVIEMEDKAETAINAYILGEVMELLSGDEEVDIGRIKADGYEAGCWDNHIRNQLRQELRDKANKKFGGKQ